jgi:primosomal protein N''
MSFISNIKQYSPFFDSSQQTGREIIANLPKTNLVNDVFEYISTYAEEYPSNFSEDSLVKMIVSFPFFTGEKRFAWKKFLKKLSPLLVERFPEKHSIKSSIGQAIFLYALGSESTFHRALEISAYVDSSTMLTDLTYWNDDYLEKFLEFLKKEALSLKEEPASFTKFGRHLYPDLVGVFSLAAKLVVAARTQNKPVYRTEDIFLKPEKFMKQLEGTALQTILKTIFFRVDAKAQESIDRVEASLSQLEDSGLNDFINEVESLFNKQKELDHYYWYRNRLFIGTALKYICNDAERGPQCLVHSTLLTVNELDIAKPCDHSRLGFLATNLMESFFELFDEKRFTKALSCLDSDVNGYWLTISSVVYEYFVYKMLGAQSLRDLGLFIKLGIDLCMLTGQIDTDKKLSSRYLDIICHKLYYFFPENKGLVTEDPEEFSLFMEEVLQKLLILPATFQFHLMAFLFLAQGPNNNYAITCTSMILNLFLRGSIDFSATKFPFFTLLESISRHVVADRAPSIRRYAYASILQRYNGLEPLYQAAEKISAGMPEVSIKSKYDVILKKFNHAKTVLIAKEELDGLLSPVALTAFGNELVGKTVVEAKERFRELCVLIENLSQEVAPVNLKISKLRFVILSTVLKPLLTPGRFSLLEAILEQEIGCIDVTKLPKKDMSFELLLRSLINESEKLSSEQKITLYDFQWKYAIKKMENLVLYTGLLNSEVLETFLEELRLVASCPVQRNRITTRFTPFPFYVSLLRELSQLITESGCRLLVSDQFSAFLTLERYIDPYQMPEILCKKSLKCFSYILNKKEGVFSSSEKKVGIANLKLLAEQNLSLNPQDTAAPAILEAINLWKNSIDNTPSNRKELKGYLNRVEKSLRKITTQFPSKDVRQLFMEVNEHILADIKCTGKEKSAVSQKKPVAVDKKEKVAKKAAKTSNKVASNKEIQTKPTSPAAASSSSNESLAPKLKAAVAGLSIPAPAAAVIAPVKEIAKEKTVAELIEELQFKENQELDESISTICKALSLIPTNKREPHFAQLIAYLNKIKPKALGIVKKIIKQTNEWSAAERDALFFQICITSELPKSSKVVYELIIDKKLKSDAMGIDQKRIKPFFEELQPVLTRRNTMMLPRPLDMAKLLEDPSSSNDRKSRRGSATRLTRHASSARLVDPEAASSSSPVPQTRSRSGSLAGNGLGETFSPKEDIRHYKPELAQKVLPTTLKKLNESLETVYEEIALIKPDMAKKRFDLALIHVEGSHFRFSLRRPGMEVDFGSITIATHGKEINERTVGKVYKQIYAFIRKCQDNYWTDE